MRHTVLPYILSLFLFLLPGLTRGEEIIMMDLEEAILRARVNSVDAAVALDRLRTAWWEYRSYRADLLPEVKFKATIPAYYKQYSSYMDANGNPTFIPNNYLQMNGEISLTQKIWLTGGEVSLSTSLDYLRQFGESPYNQFMSIPVAISLRQPIFGVNTVKWNRRIEPIRYVEAKAQFLSDSEEVAMQAINYYFQLLMAHENRDIANQNLVNASRLYEVAQEKRIMGSISGNDLLQMELNLLSAQSAMTDTESEVRSCMFKLRSFLALGDSVEIRPVIPSAIPQIEISYPSALEKALANNAHTSNQQRRILEADYGVARAKGEMRDMALFARLGFSGTDRTLDNAYRDLRDDQLVQVGIEIPLVDWGKRKGKVKVAESNRRVVQSTLERENQEFEQNLFVLVERFGNQRDRLSLSRRADEIATRRYDANVQTYMIGALSTLDLNDSRVNKDEARRDYVNQLYLYWSYYYQLRSITLWDYAIDRPVEIDVETLIK